MRKVKIMLISCLVIFGVIGYGKDSAKLKKIIKDVTKGKQLISSKKVNIKAPVIAENGAVIPISISVDLPITKDNYVESLSVLVPGNPNPKVFLSKLTPDMGAVGFSTRIRMGKTSEVRVYAVMNDGKVYTAKKTIKVTIGGCG